MAEDHTNRAMNEALARRLDAIAAAQRDYDSMEDAAPLTEGEVHRLVEKVLANENKKLHKQIKSLREALEGLVGAKTGSDLADIERGLSVLPKENEEVQASLRAVRVLLALAKSEEE